MVNTKFLAMINTEALSILEGYDLNPTILTRLEQITRDSQNPYAVAKEPALYSDITIEFRVGNSEGADITIDLIDTGNEEDGVTQYDADIHVGNDDSTNPVFMCAALAACVQRFYDLGLHTRFGTVTGDNF
jgi:hypothetical protein